MNTSIQKRLISRLLPIFLIVWGMASFIILMQAKDESTDANLARFAQSATALAHILHPEKATDIQLPQHLLGKEMQLKDYFIRVDDQQRQQVFQSMPSLNLPSPIALGEQHHIINGTDWIFWTTQTQDQQLRITIGVKSAEQSELWLQIGGTTSLALALGFVSFIWVIFSSVRNGLMPLTSLSNSLKQHNVKQLKPLPIQQHLPQELIPIVKALNQLFERIEHFMRTERRFIDNAAHELRTPLTIIKSQLQTIDKETLPIETQQRLENIMQGVHAANHLVNQLLQQAKADNGDQAGLPISKAPVIQSCLAEQASLALQQNIELSYETNYQGQLALSEQDLTIMINNLVGNAIKHAQATQIHISLQTQNQTAFLQVEDNGVGIPLNKRKVIFNRFYRNSCAEGSGLGLSIVRSICQRLKIDYGVQDSKQGGTCFWVKLPTYQPTS